MVSSDVATTGEEKTVGAITVPVAHGMRQGKADAAVGNQGDVMMVTGAVTMGLGN